MSSEPVPTEEIKQPEEMTISNVETQPGLNLKKQKKKILKNLFIVGLSWILLFTAFSSISSLQSSLNSDGGLGTISLSIIYVTLIVGSLFLPTTMIQKLGVKKTIFLSQLAYILYIAANIYPRYFTMLPAAFILGLGAAPLWTAKCAFLTDLGTLYAKISGQTAEAIINRFFGIFFAMFQSSQIWGNLISTTVLKPEVEENNAFSFNLSYCGINDGLNSSSVELKKPKISTVYLLCGIYVVSAFLAVAVIFFFLDNYKQIGLASNNKVNRSQLELLVNTVKHIKNKNQLLIIPLTLWSGFEQAFLSADFTKSYITCVKGIQSVGLIMIFYGISDTFASYGFGYVIKYTGRVPCFISAAVLNYICIAIMIMWKPNEETSYVIYIIAVLWGLSDAVWQTQINAFYGVIFKSKEEAAFSNYRLWESLGFAIAYAYSTYFSVAIKIYLLIFYLSVGMLGYFLIEFREKRPKAQIAPEYF